MTTTSSDDLLERLAALGDHLDDERDAHRPATAVAAGPVTPRRRRWWLVGAAAVMAGLGAGGIWAVAGPSSEIVTPPGGAPIAPTTPAAAAASLPEPFTNAVEGFGTIALRVDDSHLVCMDAELDTGGTTTGCAEPDDFATGHLFVAVDNSTDHVLFGVAPAGLDLSVEVGGRTITPDAKGFWWSDLDGTEASFTLRSPAGVGVHPLADPAPAVASGSVLAIGGLTMFGAADQLAAHDIIVEASVERSFADVVDRLRTFRNDSTFAGINMLVVDAAASGTIQADNLDTFVSLVDEIPRVILVTTHAPVPWAADNNQALRGLAERFANIEIFDWATRALDCPGDCFEDDHIHLRDDGQKYYASLIATLADAADTSVPAEPTATTHPAPTTTPLPADGPVEATGYRIGDYIDGDGTPPSYPGHPADPVWVAVGRNGKVIGYTWMPFAPDEIKPPPQASDVLIYDESAAPIGYFAADGIPVLYTD